MNKRKHIYIHIEEAPLSSIYGLNFVYITKDGLKIKSTMGVGDYRRASNIDEVIDKIEGVIVSKELDPYKNTSVHDVWR